MPDFYRIDITKDAIDIESDTQLRF